MLCVCMCIPSFGDSNIWTQNFGRETFSNEVSVKRRGRLDTLGQIVKKWSVKGKVEGDSSGSWPVVGFGITDIKISSLAARWLENWMHASARYIRGTRLVRQTLAKIKNRWKRFVKFIFKVVSRCCNTCTDYIASNEWEMKQKGCGRKRSFLFKLRSFGLLFTSFFIHGLHNKAFIAQRVYS